MYGEDLPVGVKVIRNELLPRMHTWFLLDGIMWHISARYHPAGISSGRSMMSCVLDSWSLIAPTKMTCVGPGMVISQEWWNPMELITELKTRPRIHTSEQMIFPGRELQTLSFEELTILTLEVMRRSTAIMINHHDWDGLKDSQRWIKSALDYFGRKPISDIFRFLPRRMFGKELPELNRHVRALIEELENRQDRVVLCPFKGLVPAEKQTPSD